MFCAIHFFLYLPSGLKQNIISTVLLPLLKPQCDSGSVYSEIREVSHVQRYAWVDLTCNGKEWETSYVLSCLISWITEQYLHPSILATIALFCTKQLRNLPIYVLTFLHKKYSSIRVNYCTKLNCRREGGWGAWSYLNKSTDCIRALVVPFT